MLTVPMLVNHKLLSKSLITNSLRISHESMKTMTPYLLTHNTNLFMADTYLFLNIHIYLGMS